MSATNPRENTTEEDDVKRTSGPQTMNGKRWEVQLNGVPSSQWLELFKGSGESTARALPHRVQFDRTSAAFRCDEDQVEHRIASIDKIASTNARYVIAIEQVRRARFDRVDAATREQDRIQAQLTQQASRRGRDMPPRVTQRPSPTSRRSETREPPSVVTWVPSLGSIA